MGVNACMVCDDKVACRAIDDELAKGLTYAALSRLMTLRGFDVSAPTLSQHDKHRAPGPPPDVAKRKRDLAIMVRDKVADKVESETFDILDRDNQSAIKSGLLAQKMLDTREARTDDRKVAFAIATLLAGGGPAGFLAPPDLVGEDENVIEGEAVEIE